MEKGSPYLLYRLIRLATEMKAEGKGFALHSHGQARNHIRKCTVS